MIHARYQASYKNDPITGSEGPVLKISLITLEEIKKFQEILNRSLNCAPEFGKDWFEPADRIDSFIRSEESKL